MSVGVRSVGLLALVASVAVGTPSDAADAVLAALRNGWELHELAARREPDPWLVVDELCTRGEHDAATSFARATRLPQALLAYVAARRGQAGASPVATLVAKLRRARRVRDERNLGEIMEGAKALGWLRMASVAAAELASAAWDRTDFETARARARQRLSFAEAAGDLPEQAAAHGNLGVLLGVAGEYEAALGHQARALALWERLDNRAGMIRALSNTATVHARPGGDAQEALRLAERVVAMSRAENDPSAEASALTTMGLVVLRQGRPREALETFRRCLEAFEKAGDARGRATAHGNLGYTHLALAAYDEARREYTIALEVARTAARRDLAASALQGLGTVALRTGAWADGLTYYERALAEQEALGNTPSLINTLLNLGGAYGQAGLVREAQASLERALALSRAIKSRASAAGALSNLGRTHFMARDYEKALACDQAALRAFEALGDRAGVARSVANLASDHEFLGNVKEARRLYERARGLLEAGGQRVDLAITTLNLGNLLLKESPDRARELYAESLEIAESIGASATALRARHGIAEAHLRSGAPDTAITIARDVVRGLDAVVANLADRQGASARSRYAGLFRTGLEAAVALDRPADAAFFLESGRALTLLEALGGADRVRAGVLPAPLLALEAEARAREQAAIAVLRQTAKRSPEARRELNRARDALRLVVDRIQREAKTQAALVYPRAAKLDRVRASLDENDALVVYGETRSALVALVVTRAKATIRQFPDDVARGDPVLVEALRLPASIRRVLISPSGRLVEVAFAAFLEGRDLAYVPSGTAYAWLKDTAQTAGTGVLAVGDPDYRRPRDAKAMAVHAARGLTQLPGTRAEAKAVGDVTLLGKDATVPGLRAALATRPRWRAVHLACHGLIDTERPALSSLALTPGAGDDGFLKCLDVYRMSVPADLVVLSACETARGKSYPAEGVVGLTRAFMIAGAPRVLVSLWKVDDQATRALMVRFYESWKNGADAARALRLAQEHVRARERWRAPRYWAAWQLWGLPE